MPKRIIQLCLILLPLLAAAQPKIQLVQFASGFDDPVDIAHCGDSRLFIVERDGKIWTVDTLGVKSAEPFLDIDARVNSTNNEQGLLGLAFHPNYAENGYFYVYYTRTTDGDNRVSRFSRLGSNPDKGDPDSELILFTQDDIAWNHNGGQLHFSPNDGYLYVSLGDGGGGGDPQNSGQTKNTLLGKILRLDVDNPAPGLNYGIPPDNPFVGNTQYRAEIWSLGWRNPWRYSFDRLTGDMWVGDVGQGLWEEVDYEPAGAGGRNYGWRCYEGTHTYNTSGCPGASSFTMPFYEYSHSGGNGCSVTGGYIYRGSKYPDLYGRYLFADYCSGRWWQTRRNADGSFTTQVLANLTGYEYSAFGEDRNGELYVAGLSTGRIYKIRELCSPFQLSGQVSTQNYCSGTFAGIIEVQSTGGAGTVNYAWSNSQTGALNVYLEAGDYIVTATDGNGCVRVDTFTMTNLYPDPPQPSIAGGAQLTLCDGQTAVLSASPVDTALTYRWWRDEQLLAGFNEPELTVSEPGVYTVQVATGEGLCSSDMSNAVQVSLATAPSPAVVLQQGQAILCPGETAVLGVDGALDGYTYQWFSGGSPLPGASGSQLTVSETGSYSVQLSGACGQFSSTAFAVDQEIAIEPIIALEGDSLFLISGTECNNCQWYLFGTAIPGATGPYYIAQQSGSYSLQSTTVNGCTYSSSEISVISTGTALPVSVSAFSLAPNPTADALLLTLDLRRAEKIDISLKDAKGGVIFRQNHQSRSVKLPMDLRALPAGTYILEVELESGRFTRQVVKI